MNYGIILWGNSPYSTNIFRLKKKELLRVLGIRDSCRDLFKHSSSSVSIYFLDTFCCHQYGSIQGNSDIHGKDTTQSSHLYHTTFVT